eukprot:gnl/TRDRNA2_/TRDRNA2_169531_c0_seq2.p1 gnl/TRDRNA2_/TRDRNA2_169531_c0~~gnl/TRDRNA2_/TRDRNA2_169531_c0_seq2.p1  ORF type:complete len:278 (+),score=55.61 gnl/TRDRNA2_/TRDRNA2_169531_c0_seq2:69-902(+)
MAGKKRKHQEGKGGGAKRAAAPGGSAGYEPGERGFLVTGTTCQNALRGAKDFRLWLEVEAESGEGVGESLAPASATASVVESLDAELAELTEGGGASRRFLCVGMLCKQVAFMRAQREGDIPSMLVRRFLSSSGERLFHSRFAERIYPADVSSRPRADEFDALVDETLAPHVGKSWKLAFEQFRGGWNTITKDAALAACKRVLKEEHLSVCEPDITVLCTVQPRFVGLAVLENMDADELEVTQGDLLDEAPGICFAFQNRGTCPRGEFCGFSHDVQK